MDATRAMCPLCDEAFTDDALFAAHLAAEHDLHDEEGTRTGVVAALVNAGALLEPDGTAPLAAPAEPGVAASPIPGVPADRIYDPRAGGGPWRVVLVAVLLLLGGMAGVLVLAGGESQPRGDGDAAPTTAAPGSTEGPRGAPGEGAAAPAPPTTGSPAGGALTTTAASDGPAPGPGAPPTTAAPLPPPPSQPAPPPTTASTAPPTTTATTSTTAPTTTTVAYAAPQAGGGRVDACTRDGGDTVWTFSYVLAGGSGWRPGPGAVPAGGGRFQEGRRTRANDGLSVGAVTVLDNAGQAHSVPLEPALAAPRCR